MAASDPTDYGALLALARAISADVEPRTSPVPIAPSATPTDDQAQRIALYDTLVTDGSLRQATRRLFKDGYYSQAVGEAYKVVNNTVKKKSNAADKDGTPMMMSVFDRAKPVLRLNALKTVTDGDEQEGYKFIFAGVMLGIRNPRAHKHDLRDEATVALEMLVMANHLLRVLHRAVRSRKKRAVTP